MRRLLPLILIGTIALVVAACGGDDSSGSDGGDLTQEEWVAAADAICAAANAATENLGEPESLDDIETFLDDGVEIQRDLLDDLRALGPPPDLQDRVDRAFEILDEQLELARTAAEQATEGDLEGMQETLEMIDPIDTEGDEIATEVGLQECGSSDAT